MSRPGKALGKTLDHSYTIGLDACSHESPMFKSYGFSAVWENAIVSLNFEKIIKNLGNVDLPSGFLLRPIRTVDPKNCSCMMHLCLEHNATHW